MIPFRILQAGFCTGPDAVAMGGRSWKKVKFAALFALLEHPERGPILYDTGYSPRLIEAGKSSLRVRIYNRLIPPVIDASQSAAAQLDRLGFPAAELETVVISHFHPDHIAGLRDFPKARFLFFPEAYDRASRSKGFFRELLPDNFDERAWPITERSPNPAPYHVFEPGVDLLGDGSLRGIPLPGHASGQMGLAFEDPDGTPIFLCSDACWYSQSYRERRLPSVFADWILDSKADFRETFGRLCDFHAANPDVRILPAHCPEVVEEFVEP